MNFFGLIFIAMFLFCKAFNRDILGLIIIINYVQTKRADA